MRTRGGIIVAVVIGLALAAFILQDLFSSRTGMFSQRKMTVGEIDGTSIGYVDYFNQVEVMTNIMQIMYGSDALSPDQQDQARNAAWESLVMEHAYRPGFMDMGLIASDKEQEDMVSGVYISPVIAQMFANPQTGMFEPKMLNNFINQIDSDRSGRYGMLWDYLKRQMVEQRMMVKYFALLSKGVHVNHLEVASSVEAMNYTYSADYVYLPYAQIPDSTVTLSSANVRSYYNAHKERFRQEESRGIEYVLFNLLPSEQDYAEAAKSISTIAEEFAEAQNPMQYATLNSQENPDQRYYQESELEPAMASLAFGSAANRNEMYGPVLNGDVYTLSRVSETKLLPDSIGLSVIILSPDQRERADSISTILKRNSNSFAELARQYSLDTQTASRGGDAGIARFEHLPAEIGDPAIKANKGDIFTVNNPNGIQIFKLTSKSRMLPKAQIARIVYHVEPSDFTNQTVHAEAAKFLLAASGSQEKFNAALSEFGLSKRVAHIRNTDRNINGLENSHELVRWAFNSKKGATSTILEAGGDYVVAVLTSIREAGITPIEQIASEIRSILRTEKKGDLLVEKMQGTSLEAVAAAQNTEVKPISGVQFETFYMENVGVEPRLVGAICNGATPRTLSKPVKGNTGVYLFGVTEAAVTGDATQESERIRLEAMTQSYLNERISQAMTEESKVKDLRVKFF